MEVSNFLEELENYAREEIVAEFTAAMLNAKYNLPYSERMGKIILHRISKGSSKYLIIAH